MPLEPENPLPPRPRVLLGERNGNTLTLHRSSSHVDGPAAVVQLQLNELLSNPRAGRVFWKAVVTDADDVDIDASVLGDQWVTWIGNKKTYKFFRGGFCGKIFWGDVFFWGGLCF